MATLLAVTTAFLAIVVVPDQAGLAARRTVLIGQPVEVRSPQHKNGPLRFHFQLSDGRLHLISGCGCVVREIIRSEEFCFESSQPASIRLRVHKTDPGKRTVLFSIFPSR